MRFTAGCSKSRRGRDFTTRKRSRNARRGQGKMTKNEEYQNKRESLSPKSISLLVGVVVTSKCWTPHNSCGEWDTDNYGVNPEEGPYRRLGMIESVVRMCEMQTCLEIRGNGVSTKVCYLQHQPDRWKCVTLPAPTNRMACLYCQITALHFTCQKIRKEPEGFILTHIKRKPVSSLET